jgi:anti-sigma B factor antagonist
MLDDGLAVNVAREDGQVVVTVRGEIDLRAAPTFDSALAGLAADLPVVVDCSGVEFMDSTALRVLLSQSMRLTADGGALHVRNPSSQALHVLQISGLDHLIGP